MIERAFTIHTDGGILFIKESDAIENALKQEKEGIEPHYSYNFGKGDVSAPGWLVWSTWSDGCGVVYRRNDGKMVLLTGWQSDFIYK